MTSWGGREHVACQFNLETFEVPQYAVIVDT